jgi:hypothetical protein
MTPVPVTLGAAAAAVILNTWLGSRIISLKREFKVSVGDGGHEPLMRRMRAQANFIENAPFFLILLAGLELSGANRWGIGVLTLVFLLGRIAHAVGMDGGDVQRWRRNGMMSSTFALFALAIWAILCLGRALLGG